ncbi:MAG: hypothetical protein JWL73_685 [Actinomycetia bacterium]|nr:hypothetical protein [Actinomycetes bacterium]
MTDTEEKPQQPRHSPFVLDHEAQRAADIQLRIADKITAFAGSMNFVYIHAIVFTLWMLFVESSPWPTLTLIVSLEAIFLSTFVMIGQNRQGAFQQAKADHDFDTAEAGLETNTDLTRSIHQLTTEIHRHVIPTPSGTVGNGVASPGESSE